MALMPLPLTIEHLPGEGAGGDHYFGKMQSVLPMLPEKVSLCYLDPPFYTGKDFCAYDDRWPDREAYFVFLKDCLRAAVSALRPDGNLFLHVDYRASAYARVFLDELLGEDRFQNEIIWAYSSGGRSKTHFSRKHDTILYYALHKDSYFDPQADPVSTNAQRRNHMKRQLDAGGRAYRSIVSAGKEYRYYEDDGVAPSDVWTDIAHLQQRDPERSGYPTQKPLRLLRRILLCASRPGDLVLDGFAGSGTSALAAAQTGRRFASADSSYISLLTVRQRLYGQKAVLHVQDAPQLLNTESVCEIRDGCIIVKDKSAFVSLGRWRDGTYTHLLRCGVGETAPAPGCEYNAFFCANEKGQGAFVLPKVKE